MHELGFCIDEKKYVRPSIYSLSLMPYQFIIFVPTVLPCVLVAELIDTIEFNDDKQLVYAQLFIVTTLIAWFYLVVHTALKYISNKYKN
jgi:hypothetical protein